MEVARRRGGDRDGVMERREEERCLLQTTDDTGGVHEGRRRRDRLWGEAGRGGATGGSRGKCGIGRNENSINLKGFLDTHEYDIFLQVAHIALSHFYFFICKTKRVYPSGKTQTALLKKKQFS